MRDLNDARGSWNKLKQHQTLRDLKDAVRLNGRSSLASIGSRSACWKAFLLFDTVDLSSWPRTLSSSRSAYNSLRTHFLRHLENPDELYDPLSEDSESSPWIQLRKDEELRAEIFQDVQRCMPENLYFRQPDTQQMMLDILFIFCKLNPDISYRQGMHELLAPILWVVERDAVDHGQGSKALGEDALIKAVFDAEHIEHDTFALFGEVMQSAKNFYEQTSHSGKENPMVARSRYIFHDLLPLVDQELAKHLEGIKIVPQVFLLRWIRLLFGREFDFDNTLTMWDVIFAEDPTLEIVNQICLAMLLRIRWRLMDAEYSEALTLLLKYPEAEMKFPPQTLVLDALHLRDHMDYHGGSHLITKYTGRSLLQASRPITPPAIQRNITTFSGANVAKAASKTSGRSSPQLPRQASNIEAVLQSTAKNLYARSEKLGISKVVRNAVDEVHRKAQEIREAQTPSPPTTWRQRDGRASGSQAILQSRIRTLKERSRQLAKLLETAVAELWDHQKRVAESSQKIPDNGEQSEVEKLSISIAKAQFVQVYLDDPTLPLPEEGSMQENRFEESGGQESPVPEEDIDDKLNQKPSLLVKSPAPEKGDKAVPANSSDNIQSVQVEDLADPASFDETALPSPDSERPGPDIAASNPIAPPTGRVQMPQNDDSSEVESSRPRLEQSPFSWMLGQQDSSTGQFSSASVLSSGRIRNRRFLFDSNDGENPAEESDLRGSRRLQTGPGEAKVTDTEEVFDLGNLRHGKGTRHHT